MGIFPLTDSMKKNYNLNIPNSISKDFFSKAMNN